MSNYHELAEKLEQITDAALESDYAEEMRLFEELLNEFKGDLDKQCVVLMGLPAAGKSTFINTGQIKKYIPSFKGYKTVNSDAQLARVQYKSAEIDWKRMGRVKSQEEWDALMKQMVYKDNNGKLRNIPFTWEEWKALRNFNEYYKKAYMPYYSCYFDLRDIAKWFDKKLFTDKVQKAGNILVIDTVAANPDSLFKRLKKAKDQGFQNSIFYLEIDPYLSIIRDKWRGEHEGRTVGEGVIMRYAKNMDKAFKAYKAECAKKDGLVDRLYHLTWNQQGDHPVKGSWSMDKQYKCDVQRQLANMRDKTMAQGEEVGSDCACGE